MDRKQKENKYSTLEIFACVILFLLVGASIYSGVVEIIEEEKEIIEYHYNENCNGYEKQTYYGGNSKYSYQSEIGICYHERFVEYESQKDNVYIYK